MSSIVTKEQANPLTFYVHPDDQVIRRMFITEGHKVVLSPDLDYDIAVFPPGPDILPFLYGEEIGDHTTCSVKRDISDINFYRSLPVDKPKIGIGRGAHLLCVLGGGRLWQFVDNHDNTHNIQHMVNGKFYVVNSCHSQMMIPSTKQVVLAAAMKANHLYSETDGEIEHTAKSRMDAGYSDVEILVDDHTNALCFQPLPHLAGSKLTRDLFFECVDFAFGKLER